MQPPNSVALRHPRYDIGERPFIVIWETTQACDLACVHCRAEAIPSRHRGELTTDEARGLIDQIAGFGPPPPLFVMTGGDPMKRPDLFELVEHAASRRLGVAFSPSATPLLTAAAIAKLKDAGLKALSLSVDGATPAIHDQFRGIAGVFDRTMQAWDAALQAGLKVQINTTVAKRNLFDLPRIAHLVRERGAIIWSVFFLVPVGRATTMEQISPDQCEDVMHFLYDVGTGIHVKTTEGPHFRRIVLQRTVLDRHGIALEDVLPIGDTYHELREGLGTWAEGSHARRPPMDVNAGRGFVFVSHVGAVYPSGFLPLAAGNIRVTRLAEIYRNSLLFKRLRDPAMLRGRCRTCEFASVCGGSRSRAFGATGDSLAGDPLCGYVPGSSPFQGEIAELLHGTAEPAAAAVST
jgi:AdoMet-dependent heme synthase